MVRDAEALGSGELEADDPHHDRSDEQQPRGGERLIEQKNARAYRSPIPVRRGASKGRPRPFASPIRIRYIMEYIIL